ncbi:hypothetical protein Esi_0056_0123 [Ectocarpus siliculosus]|uniref:Uncharacterized protein n=1 Tax=Ectocarpus siliculosus TaxID=2880 RepID=D8LQ24_ECTSI|nr:hypothetical protein Esi_0056_0123 [Ectocarpus siliculosus]|eukprot:CBN74916.1 hypothetical protein Esi_0056_0123 [Ectocarpus siliculosus]
MAWRRFSLREGKGRLERVVLASAESYAQAQENEGGGGSWDVTFDTAGHRNFMQRGSYSLGIGAILP